MTTRRAARRPGVGPRPVRRAVLTFALIGVGVLIVVGAGSVLVSRDSGTDIAIGDAKRSTELVARIAVEPLLTDAVVSGQPAALAALDRLVRNRVLDHDLVRVKIWQGNGRIVYSDATTLTGSTYQLGSDELEALRTSGVSADVSDLSRPENRLDRRFDKLLEVYLAVHTPSGVPLLFEAYFRYDSVTTSGREVWRDFAPILLGSLVALEVLQVPLAWSMARRIRRGQEHEEQLLHRAIEASDGERRRIASDLHDGVVQDLVGVSFALASVHVPVDPASGEALAEAAEGARRSIRGLRSLLVEIYPPSLRDAGLRVALSDLLAALSARDIETDLSLPDQLDLAPDVEALIYRVVQESLRNIVSHARARQVGVTLTCSSSCVVLEVRDDGTGFDAAALASARAGGHVGLQLLSGLVRDAGGRLDVTSSPGTGTVVRLEVTR